MTHTTTEEREFTVNTSGALVPHAVEKAMTQLAGRSRQKGFEHEIGSTFEVRVTRADSISGMYEIRAKATYAKIVLAAQPEGDDEPVALLRDREEVAAAEGDAQQEADQIAAYGNAEDL